MRCVCLIGCGNIGIQIGAFGATCDDYVMTQMRGHIIIICYCSADVRLVCGFQIYLILMGRGWRMINAFKFEFNLILKIILNLTNLEMESRSMIIRKV